MRRRRKKHEIFKANDSIETSSTESEPDPAEELEIDESAACCELTLKLNDGIPPFEAVAVSDNTAVGEVIDKAILHKLLEQEKRHESKIIQLQDSDSQDQTSLQHGEVYIVQQILLPGETKQIKAKLSRSHLDTLKKKLQESSSEDFIIRKR